MVQNEEFWNWLENYRPEEQDQPEPATRDRYAHLVAAKSVGYLPVTDEQLMDAGLVQDTRGPYVATWKPTRRYRVSAWWAHLRWRAGELIAGQRFEE